MRLWAIIHAEGVFLVVERQSVIIHAGGVRVGVTSSTPQAWRESASAQSFEEAPDLVAEVLEVIRADA